MDLVLLFLIIAITVMYCVTQICDVFKEMFKEGVKNENTKDFKKEQ